MDDIVTRVMVAIALRSAVGELPDLDPDLADRAVLAALTAATPYARVELLLSLAWSESRMDPTVRTGVACGVMQVVPSTVGLTSAVCDGDALLGFQMGVLEIETMLADRRVHGDERLMLLYRACGNAAFAPRRPGDCVDRKSQWVANALWRANWLRTTWSAEL